MLGVHLSTHWATLTTCKLGARMLSIQPPSKRYRSHSPIALWSVWLVNWHGMQASGMLARRWVREKLKEARRASRRRQPWRMLSMQPARAAASDGASVDPHAFLLDAAPLPTPPITTGYGCKTAKLHIRKCGETRIGEKQIQQLSFLQLCLLS